MTRERKAQQEYNAYRKSQRDKSQPCQFCNLMLEEIIEDRGVFRIIKNKFPYSIWDSGKVLEHLLLVPERHISSLAKLTDQEHIEYSKAISEYEGKGYHVYARGHETVTKSVEHQHTHLLKTAGKTKFFFYLRKPYIHIVQ